MNYSYELIEHTADVGIRVKGSDLKDLFSNAAGVMFALIAERADFPAKKAKKIKLEQKADTLDELFVNWLNELLSLSSVKELIFSGFQIKKIDKKSLEAEITGYPVSDHKVNIEIKAATYHQLKVEENKFGWQAEVIFDV